MKYLICLFLLSMGAHAGNRLPKEITDDFLKVQSVLLVQQMLPVNFYNFTVFDGLRETEPTYEFAAGFVYLKMSSGGCFGVGVQVDSSRCSDVKTCEIEADSIDLPNCDLRSAPQHYKANASKLRLTKKPYVLARTCSSSQSCALKWYKR